MLGSVIGLIEFVLLLSVTALYIAQCPFNKVEESFNTQAVHDVINLFPRTDNSNRFRIDINGSTSLEVASRKELEWDHLSFPGVVPRTSIGAFVVGLPMKVFKVIMTKGFLGEAFQNDDETDFAFQFALHLFSRFCLATMLVLSLCYLTRALHRRYGLNFRILYLITTVSQFHYLYYGGRFLPNTYAAILSNIVFAHWINRQYSKGIVYIAICVIIFRFDTSLYFGWLLIDAVFIRRFLGLGRVLRVGIVAGLFAMMVSFSIDSIFWARPVLPELEGLYFNLWLNKSHEYGIQPFTWYVYSCLPRIIMAGIPFMIVAEDKVTREFFIPVLAFLITYSFLPHKELRFILFVTPLINVCIVSGMITVHYYLNKFLLYLRFTRHRAALASKILFSLILLGVLFSNLVVCYVSVKVSALNYPGGQAALDLGTRKEMLVSSQKALVHSQKLNDVGVYVSNLAAQTGVNRFVQVDGAYYSKSRELDNSTFKGSYELIYLILEPRQVIQYLTEICKDSSPLKEGIAKWHKQNTELRCTIPNQSEMFCSVVHRVKSLSAVNVSAIIRHLKNLDLSDIFSNNLDKTDIVKTRTSLYTIRCSTRSKFNPFS